MDPIKDVNFLMTDFISRNNHLDEITKKARCVKDILDMLKENDEVNTSGTSLGSSVITLPRIAEILRPLNVKSAIKRFEDNLADKRLSTIIAVKQFHSLPEAIKCALDDQIMMFNQDEHVMQYKPSQNSFRSFQFWRIFLAAFIIAMVNIVTGNINPETLQGVLEH